jgi:hypothetical protein
MKPSKQWVAVGAATVAIFLAAGSAWGKTPYRHRVHQQHERIYRGIQQGEISRREYARILGAQRRIEKARTRALADGRMTRHERRRLNRMLHRHDRLIHHARTNRPRDARKGARYGFHH